MIDLRNIGRIGFGTALAGMGTNTICCHQLPYMLLPPWHLMPWLTFVAGGLFIFIGACMVFEKWVKPVSLLSGLVFLLIFCFCYIPYELLTDPNYTQLGDWENAEKELAFAGGAFVLAGYLSTKSRNPFMGFLEKLIPAGAIFFAITIISFGILHFMFAKEAAGLIPVWIPAHLFWIYFCGAALIGSGIAIILKIKTKLFAALLGIMIFTWFVILHIPRVAAAAPADRGDEITSAFLALAYAAIAFMIAGSGLS
jgi:uncharacterized membrane protein YphA (DoxX/SURF4 family)